MGTCRESDGKLMPTIELQGQTVHYSVRKSQRAKRISLRFDVARGFQLVYPLRVHQPTPTEVLIQKQAWVLKALEQMQAYQQHMRFERRYEQGASFPYLGDNLSLNLIEQEDKEIVWVRRFEDRLEVKLSPAYMDDTDVIRAAIENFYRGEAKQYLPPRVKELADLHGFNYHKIRIKNQKTRWGSCSAKRNLNFNMRLMMTPPEAIDSVIIHELCHLRVMNHSKAFWELVEKHCPDYRKWKKWFKENEHFLVF